MAVVVAAAVAQGGCRTRAVSDDGGIIQFDPERVCSGTGKARLGVGGACFARMVIPYDLVGVQADTYGGIQPCDPVPDPAGAGFQLTVTVRAVPTVLERGEEVFDSIVHVEQEGPAGRCGLLLDFVGQHVVPSLTPGQKISISQRLVEGTSDRDATVTTVLYDDTGRILLALVIGVAKADRITFDYLDGLKIVVRPEVLCKIETEFAGDEGQAHAVDLSVGSQTCSLEHHTYRCCDLWEGSYEVRVQDAYSNRFPGPFLNIELARSGFWVPRASSVH